MLTDSLLGLGPAPAVFLATEPEAVATAAGGFPDAAGDFLFAAGLPALPVLPPDWGLRRDAWLWGLRRALCPGAGTCFAGGDLVTLAVGICFAGGDLVTLAIRWALRCCAE